MNTTFEIGMTVAMLALWGLALVATAESSTPPMRPLPAAQHVAASDSPASAVPAR